MRSTRPFLIALLALSSVALGGLSWQQYQEIVRLRAAALDSEHMSQALKAQLARSKRPAREEAAATATATDAAKTDESDDGPPQPGDRRGGRRDDRMAAMRAAMATPEFQKLMQLQMNGQVEGRFASLFKKLNLPPEALEKFKSLLAEKQIAARDAMEVAREQGLNGRENRDQIKSLVQQTQSEIDEGIRATIGDAAFSQYQQYENTQPQRAAANQLTQRLSYSSSPLTDAQYEQFVQTLAANSTFTGNENRQFFGGGGGGPGGGFGGGFGGGGGTTITNEIVTQASAYLTTPQLNTLQQVQAEQQAARAAEKLVREAAQAARAATAGTTTTTAPAATPAGGPP